MRLRSRLAGWRPALAALVPAAAVGAALVAGAWISGPASADARIGTLAKVRQGNWFDAGDVSLRVDSLYMCEDGLGEPFVCLEVQVTNHGTEPIDGTAFYRPDEAAQLHLVTLGYAHGTPADSDPPTWVDLEGTSFLFDAWVNPGTTETVTLSWDLEGADISEFVGTPERVFLFSTRLEPFDRPDSPYWTVPEPAGIVVLPLEGPR